MYVRCKTRAALSMVDPQASMGAFLMWLGWVMLIITKLSRVGVREVSLRAPGGVLSVYEIVHYSLEINQIVQIRCEIRVPRTSPRWNRKMDEVVQRHHRVMICNWISRSFTRSMGSWRHRRNS